MKAEIRYETREAEEEEEEDNERSEEKVFLIDKSEDYRCLNSCALHIKGAASSAQTWQCNSQSKEHTITTLTNFTTDLKQPT